MVMHRERYGIGPLDTNEPPCEFSPGFTNVTHVGLYARAAIPDHCIADLKATCVEKAHPNANTPQKLWESIQNGPKVVPYGRKALTRVVNDKGEWVGAWEIDRDLFNTLADVDWYELLTLVKGERTFNTACIDDDQLFEV